MKPGKRHPNVPSDRDIRWAHFGPSASAQINAELFLAKRHVLLVNGWRWRSKRGDTPSKDERAAMQYLKDRHDYGGFTQET